MLFSYFFDQEKKHRMECLFDVLNYTVDNSTISLFFNARMTEFVDNEIMQNSFQMNTFAFPSGSKDMKIDFNRIYLSEKKEWVFEVINNKKPTEKTVVALIASDYTQGQPLGIDIINQNTGYLADLQANNLSIVDDAYVPPAIS
jgi:hypothetical protein